jgi:hypothetical protein|tara:strand:+ start:103 stop:417 length:315 start_codon:yes stop_codon:yes gene_type:complete
VVAVVETVVVTAVLVVLVVISKEVLQILQQDLILLLSGMVEIQTTVEMDPVKLDQILHLKEQLLPVVVEVVVEVKVEELAVLAVLQAEVLEVPEEVPTKEILVD